MSLMIQGLSAFPITPSVGDRIDINALQMLVERLVSAGVDSIGLLGSTGSYPYFTREQRRRAIEAAVECSNGRVPIIAGVGALRADEAIALAEDARDAGAAIGLLAPVSYAPLLDEEVFQLFQDVAAVGLPLCIYNNPATTHFNFSPTLIGRLSGIPGIVAVKNPAAASSDATALVTTLRSSAPTGFSVGFSVDWNAGAALLAGGDAWYSVLAGIYPRACLALTRAALAGDAAEVTRLDEGLQPIWALFKTHSSFRVVHLAASIAGIPNVNPVRPILPLSGAAAREITHTLELLALD